MYSRFDNNSGLQLETTNSYTSSNMNRAVLGEHAEIRDMISQLGKKNQKLEKMMAKIGTSADTADFRENLNKQRAEGTDLCKRIMRRIKEVSERVHQPQGQQLVKQMNSEFQEQWDKYRHTAKEIERREQQIVDIMSSSLQVGADAGLRDVETGFGQRGNVSYQQQQQLLQEQEQGFDLEEVRRRAAAVRQIEHDVTELSEMFNDLQTLVVTQQDLFDNIENNVLAARDQTQSGAQELVKAEKYQKSSQKRMCCLLFLILGIIVAVVLAGVFIFKK